MSRARLDSIDEAEVVLHLEVEVAEAQREAFLSFCRRAFPVYESVGGTRMELYEDRAVPGRFDEVAYYRTEDDFRRSEEAIRSDPEQAALIQEWRALLKAPPRVTTHRRVR